MVTSVSYVGQRLLHKKAAKSFLMVVLSVFITWQWGSAIGIFAKAELAQWLIAEAWEEAQQNAFAHVKPWPWADTYPVARLQMPEHDVDLYILEGAQGNSLAFGPGHMQGTALPGEGVSVIGGHRDTHFSFLRDVAVGEQMTIETGAGRHLVYQIETMTVVDSQKVPLILPTAPAAGILLVTCYPFNAITPGGPLRLMVWASLIASS